MTGSRFLGRVVVVAGADRRLDAVASRLMSLGAYVAFVADSRPLPDAHASFRADPTDDEVWRRVAPHVEQRLGPVDAIVCDAACRAVVEATFRPDLARRGHGGVVTLPAGDDGDVDVEQVVSAIADML